MEAIIVLFVLAAYVGIIWVTTRTARERGRGPWPWGIGAAFFGLWATFLLLVLPRHQGRTRGAHDPGCPCESCVAKLRRSLDPERQEDAR